MGGVGVNGSYPSRSRFLLAFWAIVVLGGILRIYHLDLRPPHHDEGVHGWFAEEVFRQGFYRYNPENYHGPFHHYAITLAELLCGRSLFVLRLPTALMGALTPLLLWPLRRYLRPEGVLFSALFVAASPSLVYYSRDAIPEAHLVFLTLTTVVSLFLFLDTKELRFLYYFAASLALLLTVKETSYFLLSLLGLYLLIMYNPWAGRKPTGSWIWRPLTLLSYGGAVAVFVLIYVVVFSGFFQDLGGVSRSLTTLLFWAKTGTQEQGHFKPFIYYAHLLLLYELPLIVIALPALYVNWRGGVPFQRFVVLWSVGMVLLYSAIPYKTPWLIMNIVLPTAILAGPLVPRVIHFFWSRGEWGAASLLLVLLGGYYGHRTIDVNFLNAANPRHRLVYVQTHDDFKEIIATIEAVVRSNPIGQQLPMKIFLESSWPLPWVFYGYQNVSFYPNPLLPDADVVWVPVSRQDTIEANLQDTYYTKRHRFREAMEDIVVYYRRDRFTPFLAPAVSDSTRGYTVFLPQQRGELLAPYQGLEASFYRGVAWEGEKVLEQIHGRIAFDWSEPLKPLPSPFSIIWEGCVKVPTDGPVTFRLTSDDGSLLFINDQLVIDNGSAHPTHTQTSTRHLRKGVYKTRIKYFDVGGGANILLTWTLPGEQEKVIDQQYLLRRSAECPG